jgi:hypothetical protein
VIIALGELTVRFGYMPVIVVIPADVKFGACTPTVKLGPAETVAMPEAAATTEVVGGTVGELMVRLGQVPVMDEAPVLVQVGVCTPTVKFGPADTVAIPGAATTVEAGESVGDWITRLGQVPVMDEAPVLVQVGVCTPTVKFGPAETVASPGAAVTVVLAGTVGEVTVRFGQVPPITTGPVLVHVGVRTPIV